MLKYRAVFICLGAHLVQVVVFGLHNNFGLLFHSLLKEFNGDVSEAAWIGSLGMGVTFLVSPISLVIMNRFSFRCVILLSIFLCITSLVTSSFVTKIELFPITYSLLWGTGTGFANHASMVLIQKAFDRRLSAANGVAMSGTGVGALVLGQMLNWLLNSVGFRWTLRICSIVPLLFTMLLYSNFLANKNKKDQITATSLITNTANEQATNDSDQNEKILNEVTEYSEDSSLYSNSAVRKSKNHSNNKNGSKAVVDYTKDRDNCSLQVSIAQKRKTKFLSEICDKEIWQNRKYVIFVVGISIFLFGSFIPFIFLIEHAMQNKISSTNAQFLISILCLVSTVVKILSGILLDLQTVISRTTFFLVALYLMSLSNLIAVVATSYWHFCLFSIIYGIFEGCFVGQLAAVVVDLLPSKEKIGVALGNLYAIMSIPVMIGPVIAGKLNGDDHTFVKPFYIAAGVSLFGATITSVMKLMKKDPNEELERTLIAPERNRHLLETQVVPMGSYFFTRSERYKQMANGTTI